MTIVRTGKPRVRRGMTLLEMGIAICIMGILLALVVPSFNRAMEQNHVDGATHTSARSGRRSACTGWSIAPFQRRSPASIHFS